MEACDSRLDKRLRVFPFILLTDDVMRTSLVARFISLSEAASRINQTSAPQQNELSWVRQARVLISELEESHDFLDRFRGGHFCAVREQSSGFTLKTATSTEPYRL